MPHPLHGLSRSLLGKEPEELAAEEHNVLTHILNNLRTSRHLESVAKEQARFGDRLADRVAAVGGSWGFIIAFFIILVSWMALNAGILARWDKAFDPYPFIFLNLMLSMLAAIQAPVIMMSQNRQAAKDRVAASLDYEVNLRAELDLLRLHEKIDQLVAARIDKLIEQQSALMDKLGHGAKGKA